MIAQACLLLATILSVASGSEDAAAMEYSRFEGTWAFAQVVLDGVPQPAAPFPANKIIISKDGRFIVVQGQRITRGRLQLDPTKRPKHFNFTVPQDSGRSLTVAGIYELEADTYKVCLPLPGRNRPTTFESKPGSGMLLEVFKRQKQPVKEALIELGRKELAGTWQAVSYSLDGKNAPAEDMKRIRLSIVASGNASASRDGQVFIAGTTKIDPTTQPMLIDIAYTQGDSKGKTSLGIYKLERDVLTICRAAPDHARPTEFVSKPGTGHTFMTYRRQ
jgi:uncharacterized protein (TIGR03067 family)